MDSTPNTPQTLICPICLEIFSNDIQYKTHYNTELDLLKSNIQSLKRPTTQIETTSKLQPKDVFRPPQSNQILKKIKKNRLKRSKKTHKQQPDTPKKQPDTPKTPLCFICNLPLPLTELDISIHINACLPPSPSPLSHSSTSDDEIDDGMEEYTWAGHTRVRSTTLFVGNFADAGFSVHKKGDVESSEFVDVDDEDGGFGEPQVGEKELKVYIDALSSVDKKEKLSSVDKKEKVKKKCKKVMDVDLVLDDFKSDGDVVKGDSLLVDALKERVKCLESKEEGAKCLICMESSFKKPMVSVGCWHVHCEECWLQSLAFKRVCPQCQSITGPSELRQIYL